MSEKEVLSASGLVERVTGLLESMGLKYVTERPSPLGSAIIGRQRNVDITVTGDNGEPALFIECKAQNTAGTAEEKLFRVIEEANRDKRLGIPSIIVFSGHGWSPDLVRHAMLFGAVRIEYLAAWLSVFFGYTRAKK